MTIVQWTDDDWLSTQKQEGLYLDLIEKYPHKNYTKDHVDVKTYYHRKRQALFYKECTKHLQEQHHRTGRIWTSYHDVDEYIVIQDSYVKTTVTGSGRQKSVVYNPNSGETMYKAGSVLTQIQTIQHNINKNRLTPNNNNENNDELGVFCYPINRQRICSKESLYEDITEDVPSFLDPLRFDTLRYRYLSKEGMD